MARPLHLMDISNGSKSSERVLIQNLWMVSDMENLSQHVIYGGDENALRCEDSSFQAVLIEGKMI